MKTYFKNFAFLSKTMKTVMAGDKLNDRCYTLQYLQTNYLLLQIMKGLVKVMTYKNY